MRSVRTSSLAFRPWLVDIASLCAVIIVRHQVEILCNEGVVLVLRMGVSPAPLVFRGRAIDDSPQSPVPQSSSITSPTASSALCATCSSPRFSALKNPASTAVSRNSSRPFQ